MESCNRYCARKLSQWQNATVSSTVFGNFWDLFQMRGSLLQEIFREQNMFKETLWQSAAVFLFGILSVQNVVRPVHQATALVKIHILNSWSCTC